MIVALPSPSPSGTSARSSRHVPLLSLAPPALALGDELAVGEPGEENNVGEIWNVITRAADLVKDGERLENLAWRHWGQPRRIAHRRLSTSSQGSASSASIQTPTESSYFCRSERRTFGGALSLLVEKTEGSFRDWVEDAKKTLPFTVLPILSVPDTPMTSHVEIRLVEPTPVPSRSGSLGGSMNMSAVHDRVIPPALKEESEEEKRQESLENAKKAGIYPTPIEAKKARTGSPKRSKFFVQSSLSKGSASDSPEPSPATGKSATSMIAPTLAKPLLKGQNPNDTLPGTATRQRRHISLATMRGKFQSEKRKAAEQVAKKQEKNAEDEESGWEDEEEVEGEEAGDDEGVSSNEDDWSDADDNGITDLDQLQSSVIESENNRCRTFKDPSHRRSRSRSRPGRSGDLTSFQLGRRKSTQGEKSVPDPNMIRDTPPPPAPTPLNKMSKKERQAAVNEWAQIEARLEAQAKRKMFAKQEIFGSKPAFGLLASALQRGASMVNLPLASQTTENPFRSSPTHVQLTSLAQSPNPGPSLLRSKSAAAMPVQTGVSVTIPIGNISKCDGSNDQESQHSSKIENKLGLSKDESDLSANYLNTAQTRPKIAKLDLEQQTRDKVAQIDVEKAASPAQQTVRSQIQALPMGPRLNEFGVVEPMTPTTRRRNIIMAEMSESLRRNVVLEREKSSGGLTRILSIGSSRNRPPPAMCPSHRSAVNLTQHTHREPLERTMSHPSRSASAVSTYSRPHASGTALERRRPAPNILSGGSILRPLTCVGSAEEHSISRTQSTGTLAIGQDGKSMISQMQAPAMVRHTTDGEGIQREREKRDWKKSNLMDTSYRIHGW
nr:hypothetical protein L203_03190 [Cryptococcus depauperatus CBS 7841]